ncbi:MAG: hypothetical protein A2046_04350 [Bacteroidetes bacterium GWA2_30_7]|nr:MAG: hypothetical protein A2046_04350 [Bacteroidetes bacterium GWA2_30_7]
MEISKIFENKSLKSKALTEFLASNIQNKSIEISELLKFSESSNDTKKATCIEAIEFVTKTNPAILNLESLTKIINYFGEKAPRIKWESAKVIGNTIHLYPELIAVATSKLLNNIEKQGTVVRWSTAFALSEILKLKTDFNKALIPVVEQIVQNEEKNSIKKIYLTAFKKIKSEKKGLLK